jgi:hypothetical protein
MHTHHFLCSPRCHAECPPTTHTTFPATQCATLHVHASVLPPNIARHTHHFPCNSLCHIARVCTPTEHCTSCTPPSLQLTVPRCMSTSLYSMRGTGGSGVPGWPGMRSVRRASLTCTYIVCVVCCVFCVCCVCVRVCVCASCKLDLYLHSVYVVCCVYMCAVVCVCVTGTSTLLPPPSHIHPARQVPQTLQLRACVSVLCVCVNV